MQSLTLSHFQTLMSFDSEPCLSLFQPTHATIPENAQDPIRFKNLLTDGESKLQEAGMRAPEVRTLLAAARALQDDTFFWRRQSAGLALFARPGWFRVYRLPVGCVDFVGVADRFHVIPLIPLFTEEGRYLILALNLRSIRMLECTRFAWQERPLSEAVARVAESIRAETAEKELQFHTQTQYAAGGTRAAVFHGHGDTDDLRKERIVQALREVRRELQESLRDEHAPLILSGVPYLTSMFRDMAQYPHLVEQELSGSLEQTSPGRLQQEGWALVEPVFRRKRQEHRALYDEARSKGRASDDLGEVLGAAQDGRIGVLFARNGAEAWGVYAPKTRKLLTIRGRAEPGDEHLVNAAVVQTLAKSGAVHILEADEMPSQQPVAAYFRW